MRNARRIAAVLGGLLLGAALVLAAASPAQAADAHYPTAGWQLRDIGLGETDWRPGGAAESAVVGAAVLELSKPDGTTGTSVETTDLGLSVVGGTTITVSYEVLDGLDVFVAGAVRMFYYAAADSYTLLDAPTVTVIADGSGTLSLTIPSDTTIGTFGLTYDASNASAGTVRFTDLKVGNQKLLFVEPQQPEPTEPVETPEPTPTHVPDESTAPPLAGGGDLPLTGSGLVLPLVAVGGSAVVVGAALMLARRRQRITFAAE